MIHSTCFRSTRIAVAAGSTHCSRFGGFGDFFGGGQRRQGEQINQQRMRNSAGRQRRSSEAKTSHWICKQRLRTCTMAKLWKYATVTAAQSSTLRDCHGNRLQLSTKCCARNVAALAPRTTTMSRLAQSAKAKASKSLCNSSDRASCSKCKPRSFARYAVVAESTCSAQL